MRSFRDSARIRLAYWVATKTVVDDEGNTTIIFFDRDALACLKLEVDALLREWAPVS